MSSIFGPRRSRIPMHLELFNAGGDGPLTHGIEHGEIASSGGGQSDREVGWKATVARVLSRRRNIVARAVQRWTCQVEVSLCAHWRQRSAALTT